MSSSPSLSCLVSGVSVSSLLGSGLCVGVGVVSGLTRDVAVGVVVGGGVGSVAVSVYLGTGLLGTGGSVVVGVVVGGGVGVGWGVGVVGLHCWVQGCVWVSV